MDVLTLNRKIFTDRSTIGDLHLNGDFFCHVLEDTCRQKKIQNLTAIPSGRYQVALIPSPRFGRVMPRLLNVSNYQGILIHWGNSGADTGGCLLVGVYDPAKPDWISSSRKTFDSLFDELNEVKGDIWMTITGGFTSESSIIS